MLQQTHPVYASLDAPLFACGGKRVKKAFIFCLLSFVDTQPPLSAKGEEGDQAQRWSGESIHRSSYLNNIELAYPSALVLNKNTADSPRITWSPSFIG
jgi:hypothetical protein